MKQLCLCGCGETFTPGNNRKYKTPACRKRLARALAKKNAECKICGKSFKPKNTRHVTCSPECTAKWKRIKDQRRYEKRIPATHKQPEVAPVFRRADDWDHGKYVQLEKQKKLPNGRTCMAEGCEVGCIGFNHYCDECRERVYRKAAGCGFLEEGGSRQSASGIFG